MMDRQAGGIGHVRRFFSDHPQPNIVFREQDRSDPGKERGLIFLEPKKFGRRKARHNQIARDANDIRQCVCQSLALCFTAAIIPKDGRAQGLICFIQNGCAVHLTGEADRPDLATILSRQLQYGFL